MTAVWTPVGPPIATVADLRSRVGSGAPVGDVSALPPRARRAVALAERTGAPLVPVVEALTAAVDDDARRDRALHVATAQTRAVAVGLLLLPVVLVPTLSRLLDLDLVGFYRRPEGAVVAAVAVALLAVGGLLVRVALRRATAPPVERARRSVAPTVLAGLVVATLAGPGVGVIAALSTRALLRGRSPDGVPFEERDEAAELVAIACAAGLPPAAACREAAAVARRRSAAALRRLSLCLLMDHPTPDPTVAPMASVLRATAEWGSPAAPALRSLAADLRAESLASALAAAERLPAQLTVPTALCLLPASVLLIGAPLVAEGLGAAAGIA